MTIQEEIKGGYKQTELGTIPQEWDVTRIVDVASITTGSRNTQDRIDTGIYPFFVRSQTVERINSYSFDGEAVLTAGDGVGTGKIFHYINGKFDLHQRVYQIFNFSPRLNGFFFYLYFASKFFDRIVSMTAKSSVDSVRREMIADMLMPLPPPAEQRAIAAALADADALVAALEGMIAKKRDLKQAAMQHLLTGKTRLPGFSGEWEVKQLGELIASIGDGGTPATKNPEYFGGDIPWVVIDDIQSEIWKTQTSISELGLSRCSAKLWPAGTLILSTGATIGEVGIAKVALATKQGICGIVFQPKKAVADFMKYWVAANRPLLMAKAQGSTIFEVRPPTLAKIEGSFPAVEEQTAIAEVLSDMDADLAALETQAAKARAVKQGMVQELLTGRVRLV